MRGRPRKPTEVLEASGAFQKHPERRRARANEPAPNGPVGAPPAYFDAAHKAIWRELISEAPEGVLAKSDRKQLEIATRLTAKMRLIPGRMPKWLNFLGDALLQAGADEDLIGDMKQAVRSAIGMSAQELSLLETCLTRMGMTPADRSRVHGEQPTKKEIDPFERAAAALLSPGSQPIQ